MKDNHRILSLDLAHRQLGHKPTKTLLMAHEEGLYSDTKLIPDNDPFCTSCKIATILVANKGHTKQNEDEEINPGRYIYLDIQPNKARQALTRKDYFREYLGFCDGDTQLYRQEGLKTSSTKNVIEALFA